MEVTDIRKLLSEFLTRNGLDSMAQQVNNMKITDNNTDLGVLLGLAKLAGGELLLKNRIRGTDNVADQIILSHNMIKRARFIPRQRPTVPQIIGVEGLRPLTDPYFLYSKPSQGRYDRLYKPVQQGQIPAASRTAVTKLDCPIYDFALKRSGETRREILTTPITEIEVIDFKQTDIAEYKQLNGLFTPRQIKFFFAFKAIFMKQLKAQTIQEVAQQLSSLSAVCQVTSSEIIIDLGKALIAITKMTDEDYQALENEIRHRVDDDSLPPSNTEESKNDSITTKGEMLFTKPKPKNVINQQDQQQSNKTQEAAPLFIQQIKQQQANEDAQQLSKEPQKPQSQKSQNKTPIADEKTQPTNDFERLILSEIEIVEKNQAYTEEQRANIKDGLLKQLQALQKLNTEQSNDEEKSESSQLVSSDGERPEAVIALPQTTSDMPKSDWCVSIKKSGSQMAITVPVLPVTAYADIDEIKRAPVKAKVEAKQMIDEINEYTNAARSQDLLRKLYDITGDANPNQFVVDNEQILKVLPQEFRNLLKKQKLEQLDIPVYFDGTRTGGSGVISMAQIAREQNEDYNESSSESEEDSSKTILIPGEKILGGKYHIVQSCGAATFSSCYHARDSEGNDLCIKVVKESKDYVDAAYDEIRLLKYAKQAGGKENNIIEIIDYFYYREHLMMVFPLLGEDLYIHFDKRKRAGLPNDYSPAVIRDVSIQILQALDFLHALNIYHLDIKPENILLQRNFIGGLTPPKSTLADLGSASLVCDRLHQYVQSRSYRAPELMLGGAYDSRADIWSFGAVIAETVTGKVLFPNHHASTMLARQAALIGPLPPDAGLCGRASQRHLTLGGIAHCDGQVLAITNGLLEQWLFDESYASLDYTQCLLSDFIRQALTLDFHRRPTAAMLLQHPFLRTGTSEE